MPRSITTAALLMILVLAPAKSLAQLSAEQNQNAPVNDQAILARAARLYYNARAAGLDRFDCSLHPDWRKLLETSVRHSTVSENDPYVLMLQHVAITLHARLDGGQSIVEWIPPAESPRAANPSSVEILDKTHKSVEQTIHGFLQFWTPFIDGSIVPSNFAGVRMEDESSGMTMHLKQPGADVTEVFSSALILERMTIISRGKVIEIQPSFDATERGLLVSRFVMHIRSESESHENVQEMRVEIYYQDAGGFSVPAKVNFEVVGTAVFNIAFDGCRANPAD